MRRQGSGVRHGCPGPAAQPAPGGGRHQDHLVARQGNDDSGAVAHGRSPLTGHGARPEVTAARALLASLGRRVRPGEPVFRRSGGCCPAVAVPGLGRVTPEGTAPREPAARPARRTAAPQRPAPAAAPFGGRDPRAPAAPGDQRVHRPVGIQGHRPGQQDPDHQRSQGDGQRGAGTGDVLHAGARCVGSHGPIRAAQDRCGIGSATQSGRPGYSTQAARRPRGSGHAVVPRPRGSG